MNDTAKKKIQYQLLIKSQVIVDKELFYLNNRLTQGILLLMIQDFKRLILPSGQEQSKEVETLQISEINWLDCTIMNINIVVVYTSIIPKDRILFGIRCFATAN